MEYAKKSQLIEKGWNRKELEEAESFLNKARPHDIHSTKMMFWSMLILILLGNILVAIVLVPFLVFMNSWSLYIVVGVVALITGIFYSFLINDVGYLEFRHHLTASLLLPIITLGIVITSIFSANELIKNLNIPNSTHDFFVVSILFIVIFMLPYLLSLFFKKK